MSREQNTTLGIWLMVAVTLAGLAVLWDGNVSRIEGALLVVASLVYTVWIIREARKEAQPAQQRHFG